MEKPNFSNIIKKAKKTDKEVEKEAQEMQAYQEEMYEKFIDFMLDNNSLAKAIIVDYKNESERGEKAIFVFKKMSNDMKNDIIRQRNERNAKQK